MKIFFLFLSFLSQINFCLSQQIVNAVMVGDKGITTNVKQAKYLVVIKKYSDSVFERLDYNFSGPMVRRTTYNDSLLKVLNGPYADFADNGYIAKEGKYQNNKKEGSWYVFDDTAHAIIEFKYHNDSLLSTIDLDSLTKEKKKIAEDTTDQVEAFYPGGDKSFSEFIRTNIEVPDRTASVSKGGTTRVQFVIDTNGKVTEIKIVKSVEFAFDEESLKVVGLSKKWIPASDKGKKLKAYRIVPISLKFE